MSILSKGCYIDVKVSIFYVKVVLMSRLLLYVKVAVVLMSSSIFLCQSCYIDANVIIYSISLSRSVRWHTEWS